MTRGATRRSRASLLDLGLLGRHQAAAFAATTVDFGAMIALVEIAHAPPPLATIASAIVGGATNFTLSRVWAYRDRHEGPAHGQAMRYAVVSLVGALLNAALLSIVMRAPMPYLPGRVLAALAVSVFYTYPLHTRVVFRVTR